MNDLETIRYGGHETDSVGYARQRTLTNPLGLPAPLTTRQLLYLWLPQCVGAAFLDGGINFAIAYAMYHKASSVTLWILSQNTVAGDMGVTTFIQGILTFVIVNTMVRADMRKGTVPAFPVAWPDLGRSNTLGSRLGRVFGGKAGLDFKLSRSEFFTQLGSSIYKGFLMSILLFCLIWPIAIVCVAPYWSTRNMRNSYTPMVIKFVYAFFLGFIQNPICAMIAMGSPEAVSLHRTSATQQSLEDQEKRGAKPSTSAETVVASRSLAGLARHNIGRDGDAQGRDSSEHILGNRNRDSMASSFGGYPRSSIYSVDEPEHAYHP